MCIYTEVWCLQSGDFLHTLSSLHINRHIHVCVIKYIYIYIRVVCMFGKICIVCMVVLFANICIDIHVYVFNCTYSVYIYIYIHIYIWIYVYTPTYTHFTHVVSLRFWDRLKPRSNPGRRVAVAFASGPLGRGSSAHIWHSQRIWYGYGSKLGTSIIGWLVLN